VILSQDQVEDKHRLATGHRKHKKEGEMGGWEDKDEAGRDCHLPDRRKWRPRPLASASASALLSLSFCSPSVCNINEISLLTSDFPSRDNVSMGGAGWLALRFCPWLQVLVPDFGNWFALEIT